MDPDTCLREYISAVERMGTTSSSVSKGELYDEADELWHNLKNWIRNGGFRPDDWVGSEANESWFWSQPHTRSEP